MKPIFSLMDFSENDIVRINGRFVSRFGEVGASTANEDARKYPKYRYVLATSSRTGATYLSNVLEATGLGRPHEYLNIGTGAPAGPGMNFCAHMDGLIASNTTESGVFGLKCGIHDLVPAIDKDGWPLGFTTWRWIYVDRHDIFAQAVSWVLAELTGEWDSGYGNEGRRGVTLDKDLVFDRMRVIAFDRKRFEVFFTAMGISPLRIFYEDIERDILSCVGRVRQYLGVPQSALNFQHMPLVEKQADAINAEWKKQMQEYLLSEPEKK